MQCESFVDEGWFGAYTLEPVFTFAAYESEEPTTYSGSEESSYRFASADAPHSPQPEEHAIHVKTEEPDEPYYTFESNEPTYTSESNEPTYTFDSSEYTYDSDIQEQALRSDPDQWYVDPELLYLQRERDSDLEEYGNNFDPAEQARRSDPDERYVDLELLWLLREERSSELEEDDSQPEAHSIHSEAESPSIHFEPEEHAYHSDQDYSAYSASPQFFEVDNGSHPGYSPPSPESGDYMERDWTPSSPDYGASSPSFESGDYLERDWTPSIQDYGSIFPSAEGGDDFDRDWSPSSPNHGIIFPSSSADGDDYEDRDWLPSSRLSLDYRSSSSSPSTAPRLATSERLEAIEARIKELYVAFEEQGLPLGAASDSQTEGIDAALQAAPRLQREDFHTGLDRHTKALNEALDEYAQKLETSLGSPAKDTEAARCSGPLQDCGRGRRGRPTQRCAGSPCKSAWWTQGNPHQESGGRASATQEEETS